MTAWQRAAPDLLRLNAGAVGRLNWQPRVCPEPLACIASRRGDILEVIFPAVFDPASIGRLDRYTKHRYRLEPTADDDVVIGRRIT